MKGFIAAVYMCLCSSLSFGQEKPVASVSFGYIYLNADQLNAPRVDQNGGYAIPQYHLSKSWPAIAELTNFYGALEGQSTNVQGFTAARLYSITIGKRLSPFASAESGDVRTSTGGAVTNSFAFVAGVGADITLFHCVYLQILPGDYVLTKPCSGVLHSYGAQVGIAFDVCGK